MMSFAQFGNDLYTGKRQYDIVGKRKTWYIVSVILIAVAALGLFGRGLNMSLEFTGGSELRVQNAQNLDNYDTRARETVGKLLGQGESVNVTKIGENQIRVQAKEVGDGKAASLDEVRRALATEFDVPVSQIDSSYVGPSWGQSVTQKAAIALVVFLLLVSLVLAIYFRTWAMALAALIALLHDLVFTVGIYALVGFEVSPATMIGFLTILGYSIYDTVVVFDKVRENVAEAERTGRRTYAQAANYAVNQTLVRSINTSVVALLPVAAILVVGFTVLGPGTLLDLALALFVGMAVGTYSSIFIATPTLVSMRRNDKKVKELDRRAAAVQGDVDSGDSATAEWASGFVDPEVEKAREEARAERRALRGDRKREVHPLAKRSEK